MKKIFFVLSAFALFGLTSCVDQIDKSKINPTFDPETNTVLTSFVFNVAATNTPMTKMTSDNTQAIPGTNGFLGIVDGSLLSFKQGAPVADGKWIYSAETADKQYSLGNIMSTAEAATDGSLSHKVIELALPLETNTLMFYGRAPEGDRDANGYVTASYAGKDLSAFSFAINRRVPDSDQAKYRQYGDLIRAVLDYICSTSYDASGASSAITYGSDSFTGTISWLHYVTITSGVVAKATKDPIDGGDMCSLGEILGEALAKLVSIRDGEIRAGSGKAVAHTIGEVAYILNKVSDASANSLHDVVAKKVAYEVLQRIDKALTGTLPTLAWRPHGTIISNLNLTPANYSDVTVKSSASGASALKEWPDETFGVPEGCAQLTVTLGASTQSSTTGEVTTPGSIQWFYSATTPLASTTSTTIYNVYYPAAIYYFGNSPVRVTDDSHVESDYPQGVTNWDTDSQWAAGINNNTVPWTKGGHVLSTTRSVAMQYNINYGTALLKSTVAYQAGITQLEDNNHAIQKISNPSLADGEEPNALINITDAAFELKGVLVGGQVSTVGWNFLPMSGETYDHNIYDKSLPNGGGAIKVATGTTTTPNYTLVWDNWNQGNKGNKQNDVYIALELVNKTGKDFWGNKNIIYNGGTFYLVGKLDPDAGLSTADRSDGITWPSATLQALPPFETTGTSVGDAIKERRVFIQDFMTTANFIIGRTSLQHAYATVPDLRSTQISLGLSVDLHWQTGLVFDNVILGQ